MCLILKNSLLLNQIKSFVLFLQFGGDVPDNYDDDQDIGFEDATQLSGAQFMSLLSDTQLPSTNNEQLDLNLIAEPRKVN